MHYTVHLQYSVYIQLSEFLMLWQFYFSATFNLLSNPSKNGKIIGVCSNVIMHAVVHLHHVSVAGLSRHYTVPVCLQFLLSGQPGYRPHREHLAG